MDFKNLSDAVSEEVVKKAVYNKLNTEVNNSDKVTSAATLIQKNQYNTDKQI